jgi:hypothetical protein
MDRHPQNDWASVRHDSRFDEYWLPAGGACQLLFYCPWCGERLPPSQRDGWFDALEALGVEPAAGPVPEAYRSGAWRGAGGRSPAGPERGGPIAGRVLNFFDSEEDS